MNPPAQLVEEIEAGGVALIYPGAEHENDSNLSGITRCILIDGTWHEARKIHQRSPYLQTIRRIGLKIDEKSVYNLRKNQKDFGLCTAECVIRVLRLSGQIDVAEQLQERFLAFIRPVGAMRGEVPGH
jgi:DTW domain-containing protein YfiP